MAIDDTLKDLAVMTPQERVDEWRGLYEQFRAHTPGSPDWYHAIDYMVGALISDHIEALEAKLEK